eukprot:g2853.t1
MMRSGEEGVCRRDTLMDTPLAELLPEAEFGTPMLQKLQKLGSRTAKDLLAFSELVLVQCLDVSHDTAARILRTVSLAVAPPLCTALTAYHERQQQLNFLPTQIPALDRALKGGVPVGSITELVGPAGVGKTQMALMLTALATLPREQGGFGEGSGVLYIDTEGKFNVERLAEIAQAKAPGFFARAADDGGGSGGDGGADAKQPPQPRVQQHARIMRMFTSVQVFTVRSGEELMDALQRLPALVDAFGARLVVVDSVAAQARLEYGAGAAQMAARQEALARQAALLKALAESRRLPVVLTNQVTSRGGRGGGDGGGAGDQAGAGAGAGVGAGELTPALGNTWAHCVNTRLVLRPAPATPASLAVPAPAPASAPASASVAAPRVLAVAKSPMTGPFEMAFRVGPAGIEYVEGMPGGAGEAERIDAHGQAGIRMGSCMESGAAGTAAWQQMHSAVEARPGE